MKKKRMMRGGGGEEEGEGGGATKIKEEEEEEVMQIKIKEEVMRWGCCTIVKCTICMHVLYTIKVYVVK